MFFAENGADGDCVTEGGTGQPSRPGLKWGGALSGELLEKWPRGTDGEYISPVFLKHCSSVSMDDELTVGLLESYGIPCIREYPEHGGLGRVVLGMSGFGMDIFVPETMREDALALLEGEPDVGE